MFYDEYEIIQNDEINEIEHLCFLLKFQQIL